MTAVTAEEFRKAMRSFPGAVSIIATHDRERPAGMVVTATCSLTADPPMLLACINRSATSHQPVQRAGRFTVNVLSAADVEIAKHFSVARMNERFQAGDWFRLPSGGLALGTACTTFDCRLVSDIPFSTHSIFIGEVEDVIVRAERSPLVYLDGRYGRVNMDLTAGIPVADVPEGGR
jgi:flavin reductase (DIM6/NTAB) family NADH-FMN oxidoreductase RutF